MPTTYYPAVIDRAADGFGVTFPDLPGCIAAGSTINEACVQAEQALALHVEAMAKDKDAIPAPSNLDDIEDVEGVEDVARVLIRADVPSKVERVLVSIDANLLRAIDAAAPNRSAFLADAARAHLGGITAAAIFGQGELATKGFDDIAAEFGLKRRKKRVLTDIDQSIIEATEQAADFSSLNR